jgi:hypothetical protein
MSARAFPKRVFLEVGQMSFSHNGKNLCLGKQKEMFGD